MKYRIGLIAGWWLLAGCQTTQAPFDPQADCPKLAYCGQCASRGGCSWCGDPSQGQCMAVGHAECTAPKAWSKTPDRCPPPPEDAKGSALASPASSDSHVAKDLGAQRYNAIRSALTRAFPQANVNDEVVGSVAAVLAHQRQNAKGPKDERGREVAPVHKHVKAKGHTLYLGDATHHRVKSAPPAARPMQSQFTLSLPMVRVTLPDAIDPASTVIETAIGDVDLSRDHLLGSVDLIADKYSGKDYLGYRPARVDLITPARLEGSRFGAIAVYLGYRNKADRGPSFYMFEAGSATGDAKMIYFSPSMAPIASVTSYYLPTPFVTMRNIYSGGVTMKPAPNEDEPKSMIIRSTVPGDKDPYLTVTLDYRRVEELEVPIPSHMTADAGARVALIAKTMGLENAVELQSVLAELGKSLSWEEVPRYMDGK